MAYRSLHGFLCVSRKIYDPMWISSESNHQIPACVDVVAVAVASIHTNLYNKRK